MTSDTPDKIRVLYVEDAFDQALLVKAFFNALPNYRVTHTQDGDHAIQLVDSEEWDLLVTDLNLPGSDGFTIIRRVRAKSPTMPILVTTGYTQAQYEEQSLRAGADQVMIKPLNQDEFISRVTGMVEKPAERVYDETDLVLAVEGRLGDAAMGCGGTLMRAVEENRTVVVVPLVRSEEDASPEELKAASIASDILGVELRIDRTLFGDHDGQKDLLERTIAELGPTTLYVPGSFDTDNARNWASDLARSLADGIETVLGYETATTGPEFKPGQFIEVRQQMVLKMEALSAYQSVGAARVDLRPRMAQAYARYWGRFNEFGEVEAFEPIKGRL